MATNFFLEILNMCSQRVVTQAQLKPVLNVVTDHKPIQLDKWIFMSCMLMI